MAPKWDFRPKRFSWKNVDLDQKWLSGLSYEIRSVTWLKWSILWDKIIRLLIFDFINSLVIELINGLIIDLINSLIIDLTNGLIIDLINGLVIDFINGLDLDHWLYWLISILFSSILKPICLSWLYHDSRLFMSINMYILFS